MGQKQDKLKAENDPWEWSVHKIPLEELYQHFQTDPVHGITNSKARANLLRDGPPWTPKWKKDNWLSECFERCFCRRTSLLLWSGATFSYLADAGRSHITSVDNGYLYLGAAHTSATFMAGTMSLYRDENVRDNNILLYWGIEEVVGATLTGLVALHYGYVATPNGYMYLGIAQAAVALFTGATALYYEYQACPPVPSRATQNVVCVRDGQQISLNADDLTVGDIVLLKNGDKIPADIRVLEADNFFEDRSSLTGETEPVELTTECTDRNPLEARNLAFFGCTSLDAETFKEGRYDGSCKGCVYQIGDKTCFGRVGGLSWNVEVELTDPDDVHLLMKFVKGMAILAFLGATFYISKN